MPDFLAGIRPRSSPARRFQNRPAVPHNSPSDDPAFMRALCLQALDLAATASADTLRARVRIAATEAVNALDYQEPASASSSTDQATATLARGTRMGFAMFLCCLVYDRHQGSLVSPTL